jgi:hypothetical protein
MMQHLRCPSPNTRDTITMVQLPVSHNQLSVSLDSLQAIFSATCSI